MARVFNAYIPTRTLLLAASEAVLVFAALLLATLSLRGADGYLALFYEEGLLKIAVVATVCMVCMYYYQLYDSLILHSSREVFTRLLQVLGTVCLALSLLYYLYPNLQLGLATVLIGITLMGASLAGWRKLFLTLGCSPRLAQRAVILGNGSLASSLAAEVEKRPEIGVRFLGYVACGSESGNTVNGLAHLGNVKELPSLVNQNQIQRIIVALNERRGRLPVTDLLRLKAHGVKIEDGASLYEIVTGKVPLDSLKLSGLLFSPGFHVSPVLLAYKRMFSAVLSSLGLILTLPITGLIALAIWLDSGRPILFHQERLGKEGKAFTLFKFRTMRTNADPDGKVRPAQENDDRFTRVGRWLRRMRLDELPQLYNILRGDMYFVGPRPFARDEEERLAAQIPFYQERWVVKPGATGWAQVHRGYCASLEDNYEKLAYDLFYIKNISIGLDLLILLQTIKILLLGQGGR